MNDCARRDDPRQYQRMCHYARRAYGASWPSPNRLGKDEDGGLANVWITPMTRPFAMTEIATAA